MNQLLGFFIGFLTGVLSGFGVGGGTLLILWLTMIEHMDQLRAGGANLVYFLCCALPAAVGHMKNGLIQYQALLWCALAGVPVSVGASLLAAGMDTGLLRRLFGGLLLVIGCGQLFGKGKGEKVR